MKRTLEDVLKHAADHDCVVKPLKPGGHTCTLPGGRIIDLTGEDHHADHTLLVAALALDHGR